MSRYTMKIVLLLIHITLSCSFTLQSPTARSLTILKATEQSKDRPQNKRKPRQMTLKELSEQVTKNPAKYFPEAPKKQTSRRSRSRVAEPKQQYVYASQRRAQTGPAEVAEQDEFDVVAQAKEFGLIAASEHCDPIIDDNAEPRIVAKMRVSEEAGSGAFAYLIEKPIGWAVIGTTKKAKAEPKKEVPTPGKKKSSVKRMKVVDEDGSEDVLEYDEMDLLSLMTPEEIEEYKAEMGGRISSKNRIVEESENDFEASSDDRPVSVDLDNVEGQTAENLKRIYSRQELTAGRASFSEWTRPSIVAWLKDRKASEGEPIRGGNFWSSFGATEVDDSGLVLVVPKSSVPNIVFDYIEYIGVAGTGGVRSKTASKLSLLEVPEIEPLAKLKRNRESDIVNAAKVKIIGSESCCSNVVSLIQEQFEDGVRGDPTANPFDRRARRRLIHCHSISVSNMITDDSIEYESEDLPDDIAVLTERRNNHKFSQGSFLGRSELKSNSYTNAYREINGEADGYPGWTVDRYDKWLFVQHDQKEAKGPLPSIHDGNTLGVYYLESVTDRSSMGATPSNRPKLLEGKAAPDEFVISENGVKYIVSLNQDLSTGIFLDQRPQRSWLTRHCSEKTVVLNCFAHTGAFSVAAASQGAATVSIDLSKKWLDRLPKHFEANGIAFDERHDLIFGDCFDWLSRLANRGEKYDIVIIDPPSTSVGGRKKKRWSIRNDMDELVALATQLVKPGGLLWTTTNSASIHPIKFAKLCRKGLESAGVGDAKLERIQPMPVDFQTVGAQAVKNFVWRIPL